MSDQAKTLAGRAAKVPFRERAARHGNPFKSKLLAIAFVLMMIGGATWGYSNATKPDSVQRDATHEGAASNVAGLTGNAGGGGATTAQPVQTRLIDEGGPAAFRLGLSFAVGYFLAWGFRVFLKLALLFFGALGVGLILLTHFHVFGLDWALLQGKLEGSLSFLQGQAEQFKTFAMGYLPSAGSAVAGTFFGFRRKA